MPTDWTAVRLGDLVRFHKGVSYQGKYLDMPGPKLLGLGTIVPGGGSKVETARVYSGPLKTHHRIRPGEIYVALTDLTQEGAVLGSPAIVPQDTEDEFAVTHHVARLEVVETKKLDKSFLYYLLRSPEARAHMRAMATGTTVRAVSPRDAENLIVELPPFGQQEAIAAVLGALDDKIELNRRTNGTLEELLREVFQEWFLNPTLHASHSTLDWPPLSTWSLGRLGDLAYEKRQGVNPETIAPDTPYIGLEHMPRRQTTLDAWGFADGLGSNKYEFERGDILFGKLRPYFHKVGVAPVNGICSTDIVVVTPKDETYFGFVLGVLSSDAFVQFTDSASTGTRMPRTSWKTMSSYEVRVPPPQVAHAFNDFVQPIVARTINATFESQTLSHLRDTLLPKLITGELRILEAEQLVSEVA